MLVADVPKPREHQKQNGIDQDGVGDRKKGDRTGAESERRHRDEGVGGVQIAADQKPGDEGAKTPAAEPPFMQLVEIAPAPAGGGETKPGDEDEEDDENNQRGPVDFLHDVPSPDLVSVS